MSDTQQRAATREARPCAVCGVKPARRRHCGPECAKAGQRAQQDRWYAAHPDRAREAQRRFRARHPERVAKRVQVFGVREDEFAERLAAQGGVCAICGGSDPAPGGWNLDHDHGFAPKDRRGHRGVLCRACNLMLGNARDNATILLGAVGYLARHREAVAS